MIYRMCLTKSVSVGRVIFRLFFLALILIAMSPVCNGAIDSVQQLTSDGPESLARGTELYEQGSYDDAALFYWRAVLLQGDNPGIYTLEEAFQGFISCYAIRDKTVDGFLFIAKESMMRNQKDVALSYIDQALA